MITIALLRLENQHLTPEGKFLIGHLSRFGANIINVNRLSSNLNNLEKIDPLALYFKVKKKNFFFCKNLSQEFWFLPRYLHIKPQGNPFPNITQACKAVWLGPRSSNLDSSKLVGLRQNV